MRKNGLSITILSPTSPFNERNSQAVNGAYFILKNSFLCFDVGNET